MKKVYVIFWLLIAAAESFAQSDYYFGKDNRFDPSIPTPEQFFGFPIGSSLARYDKVAEYYRLLDKLSDRAQLQTIGRTYENREHIALIVTSPDNLKNLESIRQNHLKLVDPQTAVSSYHDQKVVVHLGYNVHGGEIAGTEAAIVTAYYWVASVDPETLKDLEQAVVLIEPALNPDGRDRAASWFNTFKSTPAVSDPSDIEHAGGFTPHRGNHFWTDLNRDWFPLVHVESRARVDFYHAWYPNVYADYHEMGSNSAYYFEPSPPRSTWNPTVPEETYNVLNPLLAGYYARALDRIGSLYYTKEDFDNISPIYGSTYPDFQGGVGTTLEVGSSAGIEIETEVGIRQFSRNIRDNVVTSLATVKAAVAEKDLLFRHQQDFFASALSLAGKRADKYVVFGDKKDAGLTRLFLDHLLTHRIEVYELTAEFSQNGKKFEPGSAYVVPFAQPQYRLANAVFEENTNFVDSIFMDITAWSTAHGYGIPFVKAKGAVSRGARLTGLPQVQGGVSRKSDYAYVFDYTDYLAPKSLYYLLDKGVVAKAAYKDFTLAEEGVEHAFGRGAIVIPVAYQSKSSDELYQTVKEAAELAGIRIWGVTSGFSIAGIDLGSNNIRRVDKPAVATLAGEGINWTEVGETWFLLGNRLNIPLTKINVSWADRADLSRYTAIILTDGNYQALSSTFIARLRQWVADGGTLVTTRSASKWAIDHQFATGFAADSVAARPNGADGYERLDYASQREKEGPQRIGGVIFEADLDITNPLAFGLQSRETYAIKAGNYQLPRPRSKYATVLQLTGKPPVSGYLSADNRQALKNAPLVVFENRGKGVVILFSESPAFRGYWLSTGRIVSNALFFGKNLSLSGRYRP